jgi:hypothetical protein
MKKVVYGTVSALALMLAVTGVAKADGNVALGAAVASNEVEGNYAVFGLVATDNEIDDNAFTHAKGAFNIGQNASINSAVQQSMAIGAVISKDVSDSTKGDDQIALAFAGGQSEVSRNLAAVTAVVGHNELEDVAFDHATGAFQVLQNRSINSGVSQSMGIGAIVSSDGREPDAKFENTALAASVLSSSVTGNVALFTAVASFSNTNSITDHVFEHATGAFNILQNASINSSVQQSMAIGAVVNK